MPDYAGRSPVTIKNKSGIQLVAYIKSILIMSRNIRFFYTETKVSKAYKSEAITEWIRSGYEPLPIEYCH